MCVIVRTLCLSHKKLFLKNKLRFDRTQDFLNKLITPIGEHLLLHSQGKMVQSKFCQKLEI